MKGELSGKIIMEFIGLRAETCSYLIDDGSEDKKQNAQKSVSQKENLNLKIIETILKQFNSKIK